MKDKRGVLLIYLIFSYIGKCLIRKHKTPSASIGGTLEVLVNRSLYTWPEATDDSVRKLGERDVKPKVYVYDMPEKYRNFTKYGDVSDSFYGLDQLFPELLKGTKHWTNNSNEADYFYVDAWMYWGGQNMQQVIKELQTLGPWWDRKKGADHIFVISEDYGRCTYPSEDARLSIFIHHFGMLWKPAKAHSLCDLTATWGAECDEEMNAATAAIAKRPVHNNCHIPGQDIVTPPTCYEPHPTKDFTQKFQTPYIHKELQGLNRSSLLFYSGKIDLHEEEKDAKQRPWSDAGYSFGARQTVYRMFHNISGFNILNHHTHEKYWHTLSSTVFCLAAAGWGWGGRMKVAVTRGCIPLIVQDGIMVEFEEQLPLKDYAIRVPMWMAHKIPDILYTFTKSGRVVQMQKAIECTWRLHWWRRAEGRAFEVVMCELKRRLLRVPKLKVDTTACTLDCGDGQLVHLKDVGVFGV